MILRALEHAGRERIAQALSVSIGTIRDKRALLRGICPEVAELRRNEPARMIMPGLFNNSKRVDLLNRRSLTNRHGPAACR